MKKIFAVALSLILVCGGIYYSQRGSVTSPQTGGTTSQTYTLTQVAEHTTASNCWMAIDGSVYDVSSYTSRHPGGLGTIMQGCGRDATSIYNGERKHMGQDAILALYKIGTLAQ